ncbi:MAG TPA: DUF4402 domain-containing protein [Micavibrio sp.]|nr:DUF4402 domain-containing protein [Pseudomonadota bacterium]MEC8665037.1 DUF4402 domain-containing protein [Pseudomonadota bacterium]HIF25146.1 DUF4402 domain-containing protein [Micavibrio sp.]HIL27838.1 DUF4402 domain-containing protein [Micavibrio sp.]
MSNKDKAETAPQNKKGKFNKAVIRLSALTVMSLASPAMAQSIACPQPLNFGDVITCGSAGTITITPNGGRSTTGCLSTASAPFSNGRCIITQSFPLRPIQITVSSPAAMTNGTSSMSVNNFNIITAAGGTSTTVTAPFVDVPIGASLNVGNPQASGLYNGTFTINAVLQ